MVIIKNLQITNVVRDVEKRESLYTVGGTNWCHHYGKQLEKYQKIKIELSKNSTLRYIWKKIRQNSKIQAPQCS